MRLPVPISPALVGPARTAITALLNALETRWATIDVVPNIGALPNAQTNERRMIWVDDIDGSGGSGMAVARGGAWFRQIWSEI